MNILELRVKFGVFKEMNILEDAQLQSELNEKFTVVINQLEKVNKQEKIEPVDKALYHDLITKLSLYFLSYSTTDDLCSYFNFVTEVLFNWNANCLCDKNLEVSCVMLNRLIETRNRLIYSIGVMKDAYERYIDLANWQPPVFDLAINYFDKLLEENEKGNQVEDKVQSCGT